MQVPDDVQEQVDAAVKLVTEHDYADAVVCDQNGTIKQGHQRLTQALSFREQGYMIHIPIVVQSPEGIAVINL